MSLTCPTCQDCLSKSDFYTYPISEAQGKPHHLSCRSLKSSVDAGCYACSRLWAMLDSEERQLVVAGSDGQPENVVATNIPFKKVETSDTMSHLTFVSISDGAQFGHPTSFLWQVAFDAGPVSTLSLSKPRPSSETIATAKGWINKCIESHEPCSQISPTDDQWYPTRLLDCGSPNDSSVQCRIIDTSISKLHGPHMTLSHCWGSVDCLRLTAGNYESLTRGFPLGDLPVLYQDAVWVTRQLGVQYLWIDSLCIVQGGDGLADWKLESTRMGEVYGKSYCNISATHAPNGHSSMFHNRNLRSLTPQMVDLPLEGQLVLHLVVDYSFWDNEVSRAPINERAWVLQERLLSPRILHFGERQVMWECLCTEAAEIYPDDLPVDLRPSSTSLRGFGIRNQSTSSNGLNVYLYWAEIVKAYTSCKLTFQQDKLVALSSIVKKVMKTLGDEYVAGMWRKYLDRELIWSVSVSTHRFDIEDRAHADFVDTCDRTPVAYTAPSWSWASTSGKVNPGFPDVPETDVMIAVEDYDLEYATPDTTGFIRGGWLRIWGDLKTLKLIPYRSSPTFTTADWEMVVNGTNVSILSDSTAREPQPHVMLDTYHSDFDQQNSTSTLFCMPARERKGDKDSLYVLLLELQDRDSGTFRRIGMSRGWGKEVKRGILWGRDKTTQLPCEAFINGRSLVRLV
ncbi:hypothetical protein CCHR01_05351 [Colletotrichum chrysophilum]|uniref:Heterokaryon incompatibility domain-containing protein n=1 Tax=Colletotrichum chrysophilum TaxID=1836956 RepID=A0AAD9EKN2_9PEZI|nr:hypothetical protein CCHR01_05351 [Colletotrichum chrysophilum]